MGYHYCVNSFCKVFSKKPLFHFTLPNCFYEQ
jgi:hypothetical protein